MRTTTFLQSSPTLAPCFGLTLAAYMLLLPGTADGQEAPAKSAADKAAATPATTDAPPTKAEANTEATAEVAAASDAEAATEQPSELEPDDGGPGALVGGSDDTHWGGYGGVNILATRVSDQDALILGGEGGIIIDHRFVFGGAFHAVSSHVGGPPLPDGRETMLAAGYGGPLMRFQLAGKSPIYASVGVLVGPGFASWVARSQDSEEWEWSENTTGGSVYFVTEPSAQVHLNLTPWMRISAYGSYRFTFGSKWEGATDDDLSGFAWGGNIQWGSF